MTNDPNTDGRSAPMPSDTSSAIGQVIDPTTTAVAIDIDRDNLSYPVFEGSSLSPLRFTHLLFWYDCPRVYTASGAEVDGVIPRFLVIFWSDDRELKQDEEVLFPITEEEHSYLLLDEEVRFNDVARNVLARGGVARLIRQDWSDVILEERDLTAAEAEDILGTDGPLQPGQTLPPGNLVPSTPRDPAE